MKKLSLFSVFIFTVLFSCSIIAQQSGLLRDNSTIHSHVKKAVNYKQRAERAFNVIPASLDSKIPGIVEGSIFTAIEVKKYYPSGDYTKMIDKLNRIAEENPDPSIRAKAHLASIYLRSSDIIDVMPNLNTYDHDYIYKQITEQLENKVFAHK